MNQFFGMLTHRERLAGVNPLCDACLGELMLAGAILDMGEPAEWGTRLNLPSASREAQAFSQERLSQYFKDIIHWRKDS